MWTFHRKLAGCQMVWGTQQTQGFIVIKLTFSKYRNITMEFLPLSLGCNSTLTWLIYIYRHIHSPTLAFFICYPFINYSLHIHSIITNWFSAKKNSKIPFYDLFQMKLEDAISYSYPELITPKNHMSSCTYDFLWLRKEGRRIVNL